MENEKRLQRECSINREVDSHSWTVSIRIQPEHEVYQTPFNRTDVYATGSGPANGIDHARRLANDFIAFTFNQLDLHQWTNESSHTSESIRSVPIETLPTT